MNSDGIEHLIEHTPTEALEHLLQNAHNLTHIPLPPENPLQQDQKGKKIVVFRATREFLPFEQLRFDYKDPIANQLFREDSQPIFD